MFARFSKKSFLQTFITVSSGENRFDLILAVKAKGVIFAGAPFTICCFMLNPKED